mgnify:CR=1 FL=1
MNVAMKRYPILLIFLFLQFQALFAGDRKSFTLSGYLTLMQSSMFDSLSGPFLNENLLHNRLNFKGYLGDHVTVAAEFRNRVFTGDMVRMGAMYADMVGADDGWVDLSWNVAAKQSFLINTTLDRLWIDFSFNQLQVTAGRQRLNWGQTLVWNPNDIFNAWSFFDFDYVERPGSDAVRLQYYTSPSSSAELAVKAGRDQEITAAGLFRFSRWGYDLQFLAGVAGREDVVAGMGWSGAIKNFSFRGEASWFEPFRNIHTSERSILVTGGFDRIFKDNSMAQVQVMYASRPLELNDFTGFYSGNLTAKELAFSKLTAFGQYTWAVTPLLNLTLAGMWFPDLDGFFAGPSLDYSLAENLDFSFLLQHFNSIIDGSHTRINLGFLRIRHSF